MACGHLKQPEVINLGHGFVEYNCDPLKWQGSRGRFGPMGWPFDPKVGEMSRRLDATRHDQSDGLRDGRVSGL